MENKRSRKDVKYSGYPSVKPPKAAMPTICVRALMPMNNAPADIKPATTVDRCMNIPITRPSKPVVKRKIAAS